MFNVRSLPPLLLLLLCTCLFAFQPPGIYDTKDKREFSNRKDLPEKDEKMTTNINYTNSMNSNSDPKKASGTRAKRKRLAHLTRLKRSVNLNEDDFDDDEDDEEENIIEEPYLQCKENKCKNGGSCYQRGKEFWCVCSSTFAGKWCELKRELSIEGVRCDKSYQHSLAIALGVVILIFFFFIIILIYWCRRRQPRWKNEKEEWDQLLKDRLEDDYRRKMYAPPLPPRNNAYSPKRSKQVSSNDSSPKYISLTDIRKYLDSTDAKESKTMPKDSATPSNRNENEKSENLAGDNSLQRAGKAQKEPRSKTNAGPNSSAATLSGGHYFKTFDPQTELKLRTSEYVSCDENLENIALNSRTVQRASREQHPRASREQHSPGSRHLSIDSRSSSGKPRSENFPLFSECSDDPKERLLDEGRNS